MSFVWNFTEKGLSADPTLNSYVGSITSGLLRYDLTLIDQEFGGDATHYSAQVTPIGEQHGYEVGRLSLLRNEFAVPFGLTWFFGPHYTTSGTLRVLRDPNNSWFISILKVLKVAPDSCLEYKTLMNNWR